MVNVSYMVWCVKLGNGRYHCCTDIYFSLNQLSGKCSESLAPKTYKHTDYSDLSPRDFSVVNDVDELPRRALAGGLLNLIERVSSVGNSASTGKGYESLRNLPPRWSCCCTPPECLEPGPSPSCAHQRCPSPSGPGYRRVSISICKRCFLLQMPRLTRDGWQKQSGSCFQHAAP
jgi:hypothetical protein